MNWPANDACTGTRDSQIPEYIQVKLFYFIFLNISTSGLCYFSVECGTR